MSFDLETLIYEIVPQLSLPELRELCQTSPSVRQLCQNDRLWETRLNKDFPQAGLQPADLTWFEFYILTYKYNNLIRKQYRNAPPKPSNLSYESYYNLLERAKMLRVNIGSGTATITQLYIIPKVTTLRSLLDDIHKVVLKNVWPASNLYKIIFRTFSWDKYHPIFVILKNDNEIITSFDFADQLANGLFQSVYENLYVLIIVDKNIYFEPYQLADDELDSYLLR